MGNRVMSIVGAVIVVVIGLIMAPLVFDQVHDVQTDKKSESFSVTTTTGETSTTVTLSEDHYYTTTQEMSVTSDNAADSPSITSYDPDTRQVTVGGLAEATSRTLTITYLIDALKDFPGSKAISGLIPLLYIVGILGLAGGMLWKAFSP